jgi:hippurate hydrolase
MGGEDFAFMLQQRPGSYLLLGQGPADASRLLHHPAYDFNDRTLVTGAGYWCALVEEFLRRG